MFRYLEFGEQSGFDDGEQRMYKHQFFGRERDSEHFERHDKGRLIQKTFAIDIEVVKRSI